MHWPPRGPQETRYWAEQRTQYDQDLTVDPLLARTEQRSHPCYARQGVLGIRVRVNSTDVHEVSPHVFQPSQMHSNSSMSRHGNVGIANACTVETSTGVSRR